MDYRDYQRSTVLAINWATVMFWNTLGLAAFWLLTST